MESFNTQTIKTFRELEELITKAKIPVDLALVRNAYDFAAKVHANQIRKTGEPMLYHVLTVAGYIAQLKLDTTSIIAALLHDSVEKADVKIDLIDKEFGTDVAYIVDGVSNLRKFSSKVTDEQKDIENFKNLIFKATEDIRVLIIRIAEKLHNLENIYKVARDIQIVAAKKALLIYGPLCEYLGLGFFRRLIEDLAFKVLEPGDYSFIETQINKYFEEQGDLTESFKSEVVEMLAKYGVKYRKIEGRKKSIYSSYRKIKSKYLKEGEVLTKESFNKLKDIFAVRVILNSVEECYMVLGLVHSQWEHLADDFDDYITLPKENGYRSIQTIIKYKNSFIELQIRTAEMHEYNEFGPASHIAYKIMGSKPAAESFTWTKDLIKWKNKNVTQDTFKFNAFSTSVFVFTPKGLVIRLPEGSTPIDFAFRVHTDIGMHYRGALINGKMHSMEYQLKTGDVVDILLSKNVSVNRDWLKFAKAPYTRSKIKKELLKHN